MVAVDDDDVRRTLRDGKPAFWINPDWRHAGSALEDLPLTFADVLDAESRLERFAPLMHRLFEDTRCRHGIIESDLLRVPRFAEAYRRHCSLQETPGMFIKADHDLPVAGSVKARGGVYEVLCFAERLARAHGMLAGHAHALQFLREDVRALFHAHTISVASTGNLGLSIGMTGAALGFQTRVYMSVEAKAWKKQKLREQGVDVIEHPSDYTAAVRQGRREAGEDKKIYFVDDENSHYLFLGYSVAALRLKSQLDRLSVRIDPDHPLFVYLPCGVGGAPGGITFGLKHVFGDSVHCFFAEPVQAPSMMLALRSDPVHPVSVYEIGLENRTDADGLAVGRASGFAAGMIRNLVSGCFTLPDDRMYGYLHLLYATETIKIEPSAAAGFSGPAWILHSSQGADYLAAHGIDQGAVRHASHVLWTTGGKWVPEVEYRHFLKIGRGKLPAHLP